MNPKKSFINYLKKKLVKDNYFVLDTKELDICILTNDKSSRIVFANKGTKFEYVKTNNEIYDEMVIINEVHNRPKKKESNNTRKVKNSNRVIQTHCIK